MPLQKSKGQMYDWVTHQHSHLGGECPHQCVYCYVKSFPFRPAKYQGELRLIEKELDVNYGSGKTIFIENCNDMFAQSVPQNFINKIIMHCLKWPENEYVFQTKNPERYLVMDALFPEHSIFGCTIETNRKTKTSKAPPTLSRAIDMANIRRSGLRTFITIEPILDFDVDEFPSWIEQIHPEFVNIGADSKGHSLPEPTPDKIHGLIDKLHEYGIEIREKHNLKRLTEKG